MPRARGLASRSPSNQRRRLPGALLAAALVLRAFPSVDCLDGGPGKDKLDGGAGKDAFNAGPGNDSVNSSDGVKEKVKCGSGDKDTVKADRRDTVSGCETTKRK